MLKAASADSGIWATSLLTFSVDSPIWIRNKNIDFFPQIKPMFLKKKRWCFADELQNIYRATLDASTILIKLRQHTVNELSVYLLDWAIIQFRVQIQNSSGTSW